jgi:hypothetical protein
MRLSRSEDTALLVALRDDIAATTQPEDPISFTSDLICALLDEVVALRRALAAVEDASTADWPTQP